VHAAGVVADHASNGAAVVGSGIGREGEVVFLGCGPKIIENDSGFDAGYAARGIDFENTCHVFREIHDDGGIATLSGKRCSATAGEQWGAVVAAQGNGGEHVFFVARNYDADRNLPVIGTVGGIDGAAARVEANLAAKVTAESGFKRGGVDLSGTGRRRSSGLRHKAQNIFGDTGAGCKGIR